MLPDHLHAVCFDIGGTLVPMRRGPLAQEIAAHLNVDRTLVRDLLIRHGKCRVTSPERLAHAVADGCHRGDAVDTVAGLLRRRQADVAHPRPYGDTAQVLTILRARGWRVFYLSNAVGYAETGSPPPYFRYAEAVLHSWQVGACKPDPDAFHAVERAAGLPPHAFVQVGNSWECDVLGALSVGWSAVHLDRAENAALPETADVPRIRNLRDLLRLLPARPARKPATGTGQRPGRQGVGSSPQ